ncbi:hypothetical protein OG874_19960 [Nocardia sp. NBC_00565]|nr:hypothetical protein [Nocardia sp. NBC_00565]WUC07227.1 hypothetical protein OG874_19960 [Nocardia sp. NBC_00565]
MVGDEVRGDDAFGHLLTATTQHTGHGRDGPIDPVGKEASACSGRT